MSTFETIGSDALSTIAGGVSGEASVTVPKGGATVKFDTATAPNPQASDPNAYLRCLDLVGKQGGVFEAPNAMAARQEKLCGPLLNSK